MSEYNEELLNDVDDYPDLGEADEDALLQDDDDCDVLDLVPEELEETLDDSRVNASEQEEETVETHREKFAIERQRITAPEPLVDETDTPRLNNRFSKPNNRGSQRGRGGRGRFPGRGKFGFYGNQPGRNKTVLINPRFQGVVHVNSNDARLAWDTPQQQQQYHHNPWVSGNSPAQMGRPMHQPFQGPMADHPMQAVQSGPPMQQPMHIYHGSPHMQPNYQGPMHQGPMHQEPHMQHGSMPVQNMGPPGQQLQYIPPAHPPFMPQPLPPGVQQSPVQNPPTTLYWDGPNQYTSLEQRQNQQNPFIQNNYQSQHGMMQPIQPQVSTPNFPLYKQQGNLSPMPQQNFSNNPNFNNNPNFINNQNFNNNSPNFNNNNPNFNNNTPNFNNELNFISPQTSSGDMRHNQGGRPNQSKRGMFTQKRKVMTPGFSQNKKVFVQDRLGPVQQPKAERPSVVKEVTVTSVTTVKIEEDEETRDLRKKIEEQKRKREAILQWKEKRRLEHLGIAQTQDTFGGDQKPTTQVNQQSPVKKELEVKPIQAPQPVKQIVRPFKQAVDVRQFKQPAQVRQFRRAVEVQQFSQAMEPVSPDLNRTKFKKPMGNNIVITNGYSRKFTKYQQKKPKEVDRVVLAIPTTPLPRPEPEQKLDKKHLSNFLADRKILTKDESLMSTRKVVIKNISTSTGDKKIFQISKSIGEVQKLHRDKNERQATITFKSIASAHAFFKKYQRHMLDLSMIEVALCPMSESDE